MTALEKARAAWGQNMPDWIEAVAREVDRTSQNRLSDRLGYSAGAISSVLANKYRASTGMFEERVRGLLMSENIACPVLGEIGKDRCQKWRLATRSFRNGNALDVTMYRACLSCDRFGADH